MCMRTTYAHVQPGTVEELCADSTQLYASHDSKIMPTLNPIVTTATAEEIAAYRPRYGWFFDEIARELDEFLATGTIARATDLALRTGQQLNAHQYPQFFTGDLDADVVLVHLNPKQSASCDATLPIKTFEEYFDAFRHFGARMYGPGAARTHKSPFDRKQVRFLRPFGLIDFVPEDSKDADFTNLERVVDRKLQLELIPYESNNFDSKAFSHEIVAPYLERILSVISARPRRFVMFCGKVFGPVLSRFVVEDHSYSFKLRKKDGADDRLMSSFAMVSIPFGRSHIDAGWCPSWSRQGLPMAAYGVEVRSRYGTV